MVQSPGSLELQRVSVPVTPSSSIEMDALPFSVSWLAKNLWMVLSASQRSLSLDMQEEQHPETPRRSFSIVDVPGAHDPESGMLCHRDSFHVQVSKAGSCIL